MKKGVDEVRNPRTLLVKGVAWNTLYQIASLVLSLASTFILARVISQEDFGRAAAVVSILGFINVFGAPSFISHALQLPSGSEPNWGRHFTASFFIQLFLSMVCHAIAGFCWFIPKYRPIAPLLHLAAVGLLLDFANPIAGNMLRRNMNFQRLRIIQGICTVLTITVSLTLGLSNAGAYALVIASNVVPSIPFGVDLLFIRRWRPPQGWWRWPDWKDYSASLRFGFQNAGAGVLNTTRALVEAAVLPGFLGFASLGLLGRAQTLFAQTVGRVNTIIGDTVYPLLPRSNNDPVQFARHTTLFLQVSLMIVLPGAFFIAAEGRPLMRLLYGNKWAEAEPLILPAVVIGLGTAVFTIASLILLAFNRLKTNFILNLLLALMTTPMVLVAVRGGTLEQYAWALAAGQLVAGIAGLALARNLLEKNWFKRAVLPSLVCSSVALILLLFARRLWGHLPMFAAICVSALIFGAFQMGLLRFLFPHALVNFVSRLPKADFWRRLLGLSSP